MQPRSNRADVLDVVGLTTAALPTADMHHEASAIRGDGAPAPWSTTVRTRFAHGDSGCA